MARALAICIELQAEAGDYRDIAARIDRLAKCRHEGSILIRRLVFVALFLEVGLLLIVLPWSNFWERNYFVYVWPPLRPVLMNHFMRGAVTGLGFVNLIAGFSELAPVFAVRGAPEVSVSDSADSRGSV